MLQLRGEIRQLEGLLQRIEADAEEQQVRRRLCLLKTRLALRGHEVDLLAQEGAYREKLLRRIGARDGNSA